MERTQTCTLLICGSWDRHQEVIGVYRQEHSCLKLGGKWVVFSSQREQSINDFMSFMCVLTGPLAPLRDRPASTCGIPWYYMLSHIILLSHYRSMLISKCDYLTSICWLITYYKYTVYENVQYHRETNTFLALAWNADSRAINNQKWSPILTFLNM